MLAVIVGLIFVVLGFWGVVIWWSDFMIVMHGLVPAMISCGGLIAIIAGITSIKDSLEAKADLKKSVLDNDNKD